MTGRYQLSTRTSRLLAWLWDQFYVFWPAVLGGSVSVCSLKAAAVDRALVPYFLGILATMVLGLHNLMLFCRTGQTVGKRRLGLLVVAEDGQTMSGGALFWRSISPHVVACVPFFGMIAFFDGLFIVGDSKRCLHDHLAGSVVVDKASLQCCEDAIGFNPVRDDVGFTRF